MEKKQTITSMFFFFVALTKRFLTDFWIFPQTFADWYSFGGYLDSCSVRRQTDGKVWKLG